MEEVKVGKEMAVGEEPVDVQLIARSIVRAGGSDGNAPIDIDAVDDEYEEGYNEEEIEEGRLCRAAVKGGQFITVDLPVLAHTEQAALQLVDGLSSIAEAVQQNTNLAMSLNPSNPNSRSIMSNKHREPANSCYVLKVKWVKEDGGRRDDDGQGRVVEAVVLGSVSTSFKFDLADLRFSSALGARKVEPVPIKTFRDKTTKVNDKSVTGEAKTAEEGEAVGDGHDETASAAGAAASGNDTNAMDVEEEPEEAAAGGGNAAGNNPPANGAAINGGIGPRGHELISIRPDQFLTGQPLMYRFVQNKPNLFARQFGVGSKIVRFGDTAPQVPENAAEFIKEAEAWKTEEEAKKRKKKAMGRADSAAGSEGADKVVDLAGAEADGDEDGEVDGNEGGKTKTGKMLYVTQEAKIRRYQALYLLREAFEKRPMWRYQQLIAQFESKMHYAMLDVLHVVAYNIHSGPWRSLWVKFGYDPNTDAFARFTQVLDVRMKPADLAALEARSPYKDTAPVKASKSEALKKSSKSKEASKTKTKAKKGRKKKAGDGAGDAADGGNDKGGEGKEGSEEDGEGKGAGKEGQGAEEQVAEKEDSVWIGKKIKVFGQLVTCQTRFEIADIRSKAVQDEVLRADRLVNPEAVTGYFTQKTITRLRTIVREHIEALVNGKTPEPGLDRKAFLAKAKAVDASGSIKVLKNSPAEPAVKGAGKQRSAAGSGSAGSGGKGKGNASQKGKGKEGSGAGSAGAALGGAGGGETGGGNSRKRKPSEDLSEDGATGAKRPGVRGSRGGSAAARRAATAATHRQHQQQQQQTHTHPLAPAPGQMQLQQPVQPAPPVPVVASRKHRDRSGSVDSTRSTSNASVASKEGGASSSSATTTSRQVSDFAAVEEVDITPSRYLPSVKMGGMMHHLSGGEKEDDDDDDGGEDEVQRTSAGKGKGKGKEQRGAGGKGGADDEVEDEDAADGDDEDVDVVGGVVDDPLVAEDDYDQNDEDAEYDVNDVQEEDDEDEEDDEYDDPDGLDDDDDDFQDD